MYAKGLAEELDSQLKFDPVTGFCYRVPFEPVSDEEVVAQEPVSSVESSQEVKKYWSRRKKT